MNHKILIALSVCTIIVLAQIPESWPPDRQPQTGHQDDMPTWYESANRSRQSPKLHDYLANPANGLPYTAKNIQLADTKQPDWVRVYGSRMAPSDDAVVDMKVDSQGNAVVTGHRSVYEGGTEWYTIKYDPDGKELWGRVLAGAVYGGHKPAALVLDTEDNIFISGGTTNTIGDGEFTTVKYDPDGNEIWRMNYNPSTYGSDKAQVIALDDAGNIYIAGGIEASSSASIFSVVKYNNLGEQVWVTDYSTQDGWGEHPRIVDIAVDQNSSVIITGGLEDPEYLSSQTTWITVKFDLSGQELWSVEHGDNPDITTMPQSMVMDDSGFVYVTGAGECNSILTICYTPDGSEAWRSDETVYNHTECFGQTEGCAIEIDSNGDIVVVGRGLVGGGAFRGLILIKYASNGTLQWMKQYTANESITWLDYIGMQIGGDGAIYVGSQASHSPSNYSFSTIKFNNDGQYLWTDDYQPDEYVRNQPVAVETDDLGNVFMAGFSYNNYSSMHRDFTTVKYSLNGDRLWDMHYDGEAVSEDYPRVIDTDEAGNVIVAATSYADDGQQDWLILKYAPFGDLLWSQRYHMYAGFNYITALKTDREGNIFAAGATNDSVTGIDVALVKYDQDGNLEWERQISSPREDNVRAMAVDADGNILLLCRSFSEQDRYGALLLKYNSEGTLLFDVWNTNIDYNSYVSGMKVLPHGDIYVVGQTLFSSDFSTWVVKYNSNGTLDWENIYDAEPDNSAIPILFNVSKTGATYLVMETWGSLGSNKILVKYDASGKMLYKRILSGQQQWYQLLINYSNQPIAIGSGGGGIISKYSPGWALQWSDTLSTYIHSGAIDNFDNIYIFGNIFLNDVYSPYLIKYNTAGDQQWLGYHNNINNINSNIRMATVDVDGNVYMLSGIENGEITIIKYAADKDIPDVSPGDFAYSYPNPFNGSTAIIYRVTTAADVKLKIFNLLGQEVAKLVDWYQEPGQYRMEWRPAYQPSGIYFYQLQLGKQIESKKMVYLK